MDLLNLSNLKVVDMKEFDDDYRFLVESTAPPPSHCPKCGIIPNLYKHGKKEQLFFDLPMHAKRVGLIIKRQRYKCRESDIVLAVTCITVIALIITFSLHNQKS